MSAGIYVTKQAVLQPSQLFLDRLLNNHNPLNGIIEDNNSKVHIFDTL